MRPLSTEAFLDLAESRGIGYDPRYPQAQNLIFLPPNDASRFWVRPDKPSQWPHFVASVLDAAGADDTVLAFPRRGTWPGIASACSQLDRTQGLLAEALGVPGAWSGAIEFESSDRERLIAILVAQFLEPVNNLYVLPLDGKAFAEFSHHDVVHVSCATIDGIETVVAAMAAARYPLPEDPPDATFKRPRWMQSTGDDL
jgi:hypothetical protein